MGLLDTQIRNIVSSSVNFVMLDATLRKWTAGTFSQTTQKRTARTAVDYGVKGFIDDDVSRYMPEAVVAEADAVAGIVQVGAGADPQVGDHFVLRGTWRIIKITEDPASAMWFCAVISAGDEA